MSPCKFYSEFLHSCKLGSIFVRRSEGKFVHKDIWKKEYWLETKIVE